MEMKQESVSELFILQSESSENSNCADCSDPGTGSDGCRCEDF